MGDTFVKTFSGISNPAGSASTVALTLPDFEVTTNRLYLEIPYTGTWTMITEASFTGASAIPEPSTYAALAGALALGVVVWRLRTTSTTKR